MRYSWLAAGAAAVLALGVAACGSDNSSSSGSGSGGSLTGAGATFPAPFYSELASQVKSKDDLTVNYNAVGSGAGLAQFTQKTVDFGASDPPLKPDELAAAKTAGGTDPVQVPTVLGRLTPAFWPAIFGSFHFVILPEKMSAIVAPSSLRPVFTPERL